MLLNLFKKKKKVDSKNKQHKNSKTKGNSQHVANRKGEIGEYKIDIQLSQLPKEYKYLNDIMIENSKSITGYSQIDHLVITPYGIFVIETKNYQGTIYGGKNRKTWLVNGKFKMLSPIIQNYGHIKALKYYINKKYHDTFFSIVSFTKRCTLKIDSELRDIKSDEFVIYDLYLTESIERKVSILKLIHKEPLLTEKDCLEIYHVLKDANITDAKARADHNFKIKQNKEEKSRTESHAKCVVCNKSVSQKVASFCLSNNRFKGKVYCYEHQKTVV
ncbi:Nuclease-related domain-containing protein [Oceanobacillus limi]|uniref:Nuclease-related domain-containing protein n=1 Tax=Oceanobacillus limi TaxID=930131 RepID=A0A1H9Y0A9_9BACI|nr:nuclease-related domain-containing protein [Oceanobacillus limi]SES62136.1 Nuclease-related domain-containing protein [Oceanobacillus limi]